MLRPDLTFPPPADRVELAADLFRALADPTRLSLLLALRSGERTVGDLVAAVDRPQSTVSRHLALLRQADLVRTRRVAQSVHYALASVHVEDVLSQAISHADHVLGHLPHDHPDADAP